MSSHLPIPSKLEQHLLVLEEQVRACETFVEQSALRDQLKSYQAAATIYKRKDLASEFSVLIRKCEFVIAKTNPPIPNDGSRGNQVTDRQLVRINSLSKATLSEIRKANENIETMEELDEICQPKREAQEVVSMI